MKERTSGWRSLTAYRRQLQQFPPLTSEEMVLRCQRLNGYREEIQLLSGASPAVQRLWRGLYEQLAVVVVGNSKQINRWFFFRGELHPRRYGRVAAEHRLALLRVLHKGIVQPAGSLAQVRQQWQSIGWRFLLFRHIATLVEAQSPIHQRWQQLLQARQEIIECNARLVTAMAARIGGDNPEYILELVQLGNIGLCEAVDTFDHTVDVTFTTYAYPWIMRQMRQYWWGYFGDRPIKLPQHIRTQLLKVIKEIKIFRQEHLRYPTALELVVRTSFSHDDVMLLQQFILPVVSLQQDISEAGNGSIELQDALPAVIASPLQELERHQARLSIERLLGTLSAEEAQIIRYRFGLEDDMPPASHRWVGDRLGKTAEAIRQIEERALRRLKNSCSPTELLGAFSGLVLKPQPTTERKK